MEQTTFSLKSGLLAHGGKAVYCFSSKSFFQTRYMPSGKQIVIGKVTQSCPTLCDPVDYTVHGILQARILERVAFPFSRGSSEPRFPALQAGSLSTELSGKPSEYSGLISFSIDWFDLLAVQETLSLLQHHSSKASILQHSAFFIDQLLHPYVTNGL